MIDKLMASLPALTPDGRLPLSTDVLRGRLEALAASADETMLNNDWRKSRSEGSMNQLLEALASKVSAAVIEGSKTTDPEIRAHRLAEILRWTTEAYLLIGMGDNAAYVHLLTSVVSSTSIPLLGILAAVPISLVSNDLASISIVVPYGFWGGLNVWNLWRYDFSNKIPRLYPRFLRNLINKAAGRNAIHSHFWKIVAQDLKSAQSQSPEAVVFLNRWIPTYDANAFWFSNVKALRAEGQDPGSAFFKALSADFVVNPLCFDLLMSGSPNRASGPSAWLSSSKTP
jgi:hypothetical protein